MQVLEFGWRKKSPTQLKQSPSHDPRSFSQRSQIPATAGLEHGFPPTAHSELTPILEKPARHSQIPFTSLARLFNPQSLHADCSVWSSHDAHSLSKHESMQLVAEPSQTEHPSQSVQRL